MPLHNVKFNLDWLRGKDCNDQVIKDWCEPGDSEFVANCFVCHKTIDIRNRGKGQLLAHAGTKTHQVHAAGLLQKSQTKLVTVTNDEGEKIMAMDLSSATPGSAPIYKMTHDDEVARAEIIWTMKVAESGYSYSSCDSLNDVFETMFPDSPIAKSFTLGAQKISYEVAHGLGPFFHQEIVDEIKTSKALYTLSFDEATNDCGKKQLDLHLRWWGNSGVKNYYFCTYLLGHATAEIMRDKILDALNEDELSLSQLLMLSSDGPNVNKKLLKLMDELLKSKIPGHRGLIHFGSCNLHIVHNSFGHAMKEFSSWGVEEFLDAVFKYFSKYPARKEDFEGVQKLLEIEHKEFMRYVNSRWISLVPVIERVLEQYEALHHYFLSVVPKQSGKTDSFYAKRISAALNAPSTIVRLHFLKSVGSLYMKFLTFMQSDQPLIHLLYDELVELIRSLMARFVKPELIQGVSGHSLCKVDLSKLDNLMSLETMKVGEETRKAIRDSKLKSSEVSLFQFDARKFLTLVVKYLVDRVPLDSKLLRNLQCLHPLMRTEDSSGKSIKEVAKEMLSIVPLSEHDQLIKEWQLYANEDVPKESYMDKEYDSPEGHCISWKRVDLYWKDILNKVTNLGTPKYPILGKLVKAALTLSHGQAHVERGFSLNKTFVTTSRSCLNEKSINGLRIVQDKVKHEGGANKVPITAKTIQAFRRAHSKYKSLKEAERKAAEEKQRNEEKQKEEEKRLKLKRKQEEKEANLLKKQKVYQDEIEASRKLVSEANQRLKKACTTRKINPAEVAAAQALLESGSAKLSKSSSELKKVSEEIAEFNKKKKNNVSQ